MPVDLLHMVESGGCSAKISPALLGELLKDLPFPDDPDILVNIDTHDDAGVYRINDDLALVLTTDFFPPVCSDPFEFGQIAAVNSISDIYAMGGTPVVALNIMMFPSAKLPLGAYAEILRGGLNKASEAGVRIIGGHTIDDFPPKYGLAVVGFIHPEHIITNSGARPGDILILTKPLGTGIILAGQKMNLSTPGDLGEALKYMKILNSAGAGVMKKFNIRGATDVTGYGLAGHALKMAAASNVSISLNMSRVPLIGSSYTLVNDGCIPGAAFRNLEFVSKDALFGADLDYNLRMIAMDAQTSGGLLMAAPPSVSDQVIRSLYDSGVISAAIIGEVKERGEKLVYISN